MQRIYRVTIVLLVIDDFPIFDWRHDAHSQLILCNSDKRSSKFGLTGGWRCYEGPGVQPYSTGDTAKEDALDYATAPAKFEGGEFRGLIFRLLRDNSKSGCSLFSESLAEKSFRHDNCCSSLGGIAQLVERLVRNESTANMLTLSHALTRAQLEGTALNRGYLTLSHVVSRTPKPQGRA